jgi:hypothetical protein
VNIVSNNLSKAPEEKKNSTNEKSQVKLEDHTGNLAAKKKKKTKPVRFKMQCLHHSSNGGLL